MLILILLLQVLANKYRSEDHETLSDIAMNEEINVASKRQ